MIRPRRRPSAPSMRFPALLLAGSLAGLLLPAHSAPAQTPDLVLTGASVLPGQESVPLELRLSHIAAVEGIEVGLDVSTPDVAIVEVFLAGGVLDGLTLEFAAAAIDAGGGEASLRFILDSTPPFSPTIPAGSDRLIATLLVDIDPDIVEGTTAVVAFVDGSGTPPTQNRVRSGGVSLVPDTSHASIHVPLTDFLAFRTDDTFGGAVDHLVEVVASNSSNIQGFSTVVSYDPALLECVGVDVIDTITEAVGVEFQEEIIQNGAGYAILGVLLDIIPPFQGQVIPVTGFDLPIANYRFDVTDQVQGEVFTPIRFTDGLGSPPIENIFVVGNQSIQPQTTDTFLRVLGLVDFLRGDADRDLVLELADIIINFLYVTNALATCPTCPEIDCTSALDVNDDGDVDLADGIYLGTHLFLAGPPPPPPYPTEGPDPTPDGLTCE